MYIKIDHARCVFCINYSRSFSFVEKYDFRSLPSIIKRMLFFTISYFPLAKICSTMTYACFINGTLITTSLMTWLFLVVVIYIYIYIYIDLVSLRKFYPTILKHRPMETNDTSCIFILLPMSDFDPTGFGKTFLLSSRIWLANSLSRMF